MFINRYEKVNSEIKMKIEIKPQERIDELGRNGYRILQDPDRFCVGMDAVLLSDFATVKEGARVIDFCTGTGIIPILMEARTKAASFEALEIQEESADMARRSVQMNQLEDKIKIITGDVTRSSEYFVKGSYDAVTCNPPYMIGQHGLVNPESPKAIARHEILCTLEDVIREAAGLLKQQGSFYLVHRPFRLAEIMNLCTKYKMEPKRMRMVHPYINKEPNMVLLQAVKGGKPRLSVEAPLIVYESPGVYTEEIYEIYGMEKKENNKV